MLDPILNAPSEIQTHVAFALVALMLGPFALFRQRRDQIHKITGYIWIIAMVGLSVSGLFIHSEIAVIAHFGPIHLLSLYALWGVSEGLYHVRRRNIPKHRASMQAVWFGAMGIAGLLTFLPGRILNRILFGAPSELGYGIIAAGLIGLWFLRRWHLARVS